MGLILVYYYLNDCIEQSLLEGLEVLNGESIKGATTLIHNNKRYRLNEASYITAVLALIQPVSCKDERFESMSFLALSNSGLISTTGSVTIPMKSDSSDDYFKCVCQRVLELLKEQKSKEPLIIRKDEVD